MDEKIKTAITIFLGIIGGLGGLAALLNVLPTRTSARVAEDKFKFDKEAAREKQAADEYAKLLADRDKQQARAEKAEAEVERQRQVHFKEMQELRDTLFACQDDWHKWKRLLEQDGVIKTEAKNAERAMSGNDTEP